MAEVMPAPMAMGRKALLMPWRLGRPKLTLEAPQVKGLGPDLVEVTWKAPRSTGIVVSSYVIKRQLLPNGELEEVKTVPGNETTTTISVDPGKKYKFKVEAKTDDGMVSKESSFSSPSGGLVPETLKGHQLDTVLEKMHQKKSGSRDERAERLRGILANDVDMLGELSPKCLSGMYRECMLG